MNCYRSLLLVCLLAGSLEMARPEGAAPSEPKRASSEFRKQSNGIWLFVDGARMPAFAGAVYQNTAGDMHVVNYSNSLHSLYYGLDQPVEGGAGHGERLARMGFQAIRVYQMPVENQDDANRTKEIFRRLYSRYGIKVLIGDWAGLHTGIDFGNTNDLARVRTHVDRLVGTYADEPWLLGWQLGNENNYHTLSGKLGHEIKLSEAGYYSFMNELAGQIKGQLGKRHLTQFVSLGQGDLTEPEAALIAGATNFDAVGINCYRDDPNAFEEVIALAAAHLKVPIYFSEIGWPAKDHAGEEKQSDYLWHALATIFSHSAGRVRSGIVIGAFVHEATDEAWKKLDRGVEEDAHYGILGKATESSLQPLLTRNHQFGALVVPVDDAPDTLINSAWQCLNGSYTRSQPRDYGYAMAYANRAIGLYQDEARKQQAELLSFKSPPEVAGNPKFWALNSVGTGYFIIGDAWMLLSYDFRGGEREPNVWRRTLQLADFRESDPIVPKTTGDIVPTNAANCVYFARQVFAQLRTQYSYAHLREPNGTYRPFEKAIKSRFPEMLPPYIPLTLRNGAIFTGSLLFLILGFASLSGYLAKKASVKTESVLSPGARVLFVLALIFNLVCLFWFVSWWFSPVRIEYYTVRPALFWTLTGIGAVGVFFYFFIWYLLWNMRRPVPMEPAVGLRVALVTTRVASEPVEALEETFRKMAAVTYPHDSYLLDEEDNPEAIAACHRANVIHFSRRGRPEYNTAEGKFQARTKGGNLNSWLYEFGKKYEFVTFLDPDHGPHPDFLDKVLGYFANKQVAFVQGPQVLYNHRANWIARGATEQSYLFYGPFQMGLFGIGACVVNGSHSTFRVQDLFALKGDGYAVHDADDILTSMRIHALGKRGVYVPEVIAEGLAPETWEEFSKQQARWAYSMFHLLFYFYIPGLFRMPWRCKIVYLVLTSFYFRGVLFCGLLLLPFISAFTGNPPVNAHIAAFCLRFLPFFMVHYGILVFLGQRFLIPGGSRRGFWYRAGILWVAMWWHHLGALAKALRTGRVKDRVVAAKWKSGPVTPWRAVRPHLVLTVAAAGAFAWTLLRTGRTETVWGTLLFLGLIVLSQGFIIFKVTRTPREFPSVRHEAREPGHLAMPTAYSKQP
jgi:cellulose synthase/poly-beta-1,6-N-acetylglucosamine synthase-like glycosyltransferase